MTKTIGILLSGIPALILSTCIVARSEAHEPLFQDDNIWFDFEMNSIARCAALYSVSGTLDTREFLNDYMLALVNHFINDEDQDEVSVQWYDAVMDHTATLAQATYPSTLAIETAVKCNFELLDNRERLEAAITDFEKPTPTNNPTSPR